MKKKELFNSEQELQNNSILNFSGAIEKQRELAILKLEVKKNKKFLLFALFFALFINEDGKI